MLTSKILPILDMDCESCLFMNIHAVDLPSHWPLVSEKTEALCQPAEILPDNEKFDGWLLLWVMMSVPTTFEQKAQSFRLVLFKHFIICGQDKLEVSLIYSIEFYFCYASRLYLKRACSKNNNFLSILWTCLHLVSNCYFIHLQ